MARTGKQRRGVLLLVVLSMLVLFAVISITFVLTSGQYRRSSMNEGRSEQYGNDAKDTLDDAAMQVFRGTPDPYFRRPVSVLAQHSLLEDMYGQDQVYGNLVASPSGAANATPSGGQLITLCVQRYTDPLNSATFNPANYNWAEPYYDSVTINGSYTAGSATAPAEPYFDRPGLPSSAPNNAYTGANVGYIDNNRNGRYDPIWSDFTGYYNGCVLTMLAGPASGQSTRVVGYKLDGATSMWYVTVLPFEKVSTALVTANSVAGQAFIINGRPFNGTGGGYNSTTGRLDAALRVPNPLLNPPMIPLPLALLPNLPVGLHVPDGPGGADEDYDAADFQNMALGRFPPNPDTSLPPSPASDVIIPSLHRQHLINFWFNELVSDSPRFLPTTPATILGSLTPDQRWLAVLYPYGQNCIPNDGDDPAVSPEIKNFLIAMRRMIIFRPLPEDHPFFTGSNPFSRIGSNDGTRYFEKDGPWDVDNDNDGTPDSIWVDLGFPAQMAPDGRMYKPLFAIKCTDLDGRLNLNAHGSPAELDITSSTESLAINNNLLAGAPGGVPPASLHFGQGVGVNEVFLNQLFPDRETYQRFLYGSNANTPPTNSNPPHLWDGRYGQATFGAVANERRAGRLPNADDPLSAVKHYDWPVEYTFDPARQFMQYVRISGTPLAPLTWMSYGSPMDFRGHSFWGVDRRGAPIAFGRPNAWNNAVSPDRFDDLYEMNFARKNVRSTVVAGGYDNLYSVAEHERILRPYDGDSNTLPDRLRWMLDPRNEMVRTLSPGVRDPRQLRHLTTVESNDLPSPNFSTTREARAQLAPANTARLQYAGHIADLLRSRMPIATASNPALANPIIASLLPPELLTGVRMNINRPLGNGLDDNSNGAIDEPLEAAIETVLAGTVFGGSAGVAMDHDNDGTANAANDRMARATLARHLYVLALLTCGTQQFDFNLDGQITANETQFGLAQWAVNAVDFRDRDAIMTPFEFDTNPFNGWTVDGNPATSTGETERGVVWGCERPELLISETVATHDLRIEDTSDEGGMGMGKKANDPDPTMREMDGTNDFDQRLWPRGSLFVELYNPWAGSEAYQNELYYDTRPVQRYLTGNPFKGGVVLDKLTPAGTGMTIGSPVWRLQIVKGSSIGNDPDYPQGLLPAGGGVVAADIERSAYFVIEGTSLPRLDPAVDNATQVQYLEDVNQFTSNGYRPAPLMPGRYAVIGGYPDTSIPPAAVSGVTECVTPIGRRTGLPTTIAPGTTGRTQLQIDQTRQFVLRPHWNPNVNQFLGRNTGAPDSVDAQPTVVVPINVIWDSAASARVPRNFSISEPPNDYPTPFRTATPGERDAEGGEGALATVRDQPFDMNRTDLGGGNLPFGTTYGYREIHLQRLADPTIAWNPLPPHTSYRSADPVNPYLTIDSMTVDLTVYNGVTTEQSATQLHWPTTATADRFTTMQRGEHDTTNSLKLWPHEPSNVTGVARPGATPNPTPVASHYMTRVFHHSLGYLNHTNTDLYQFPPPTDRYFTSATAPAHPYDGGGSSPVPFGSTTRYYAGAPANGSFPWLTWNNRPYVGPLELMLVPKSRSSRLLYEFNIDIPAFHPYAVPPVGATPPSPLPPHSHLLNFFQTPRYNQNGAVTQSNALYRIFEYLQVPTKFLGTETYLQPTNSLINNSTLATTYGVNMFPPFNSVSNFRDPGRININTIQSDTVLGAVRALRGWPSWTSTTPDGLRDTLRGYRDPANARFFPSPIMNPFRSFGSADLGLASPHSVTNWQLWNNQGFQMRDEVDVTFFRKSDSANWPADSISDTPFFAADPTPPATNQFDNRIRNPYFRFQDMQRYHNMFTTRSNVYAVWMTVGYFEVQPWNPANPANPGTMTMDFAHPDGYQLMAELGAETGETKRHRAFYMFDRTIPVGFQRGKNLNVDDAILLKRFIE